MNYIQNKEYINHDKIENKANERIVVELPCGHNFDIDLYVVSTVRQIIMKHYVYCIECENKYESNQSDVIKRLYYNIQDEKSKFNIELQFKNLNRDEKENLKYLRKEFYLNKLKKNKPNMPHMELIIKMFELLFDTIYFI